jgi:hypothetical protein
MGISIVVKSGDADMNPCCVYGILILKCSRKLLFVRNVVLAQKLLKLQYNTSLYNCTLSGASLAFVLSTNHYMAGEEAGGNELPCVNHVPLYEGAVGKIIGIHVSDMCKIKVTFVIFGKY